MQFTGVQIKQNEKKEKFLHQNLINGNKGAVILLIIINHIGFSFKKEVVFYVFYFFLQKYNSIILCWGEQMHMK